MIIRKDIFAGVVTVLIFGILVGMLFNSLVPYTTAHDVVTTTVTSTTTVEKKEVGSIDIFETITNPDGTVTVTGKKIGTRKIFEYHYKTTTTTKTTISSEGHKHWWERVLDAIIPG